MKQGFTKAELVKSLEFTLKLTDEEVANLELRNADTVTIHYVNGYSKNVYISDYSGLGILRTICAVI